MRDMWLRIGGALTIAVAIYLFLSAIQQDFTPFEYAVFPIWNLLVSTEKEIAQSVSYSLWSQRSPDVVFLAFLLFVASACCVSILTPEKGMKK